MAKVKEVACGATASQVKGEKKERRADMGEVAMVWWGLTFYSLIDAEMHKAHLKGGAPGWGMRRAEVRGIGKRFSEEERWGVHQAHRPRSQLWEALGNDCPPCKKQLLCPVGEKPDGETGRAHSTLKGKKRAGD